MEAGHETRVKRLYYDQHFPTECYNGGTFSPILSENERQNFYKKSAEATGSNLEVSKEVQEAIEDLKWCNSILFVYPTWWSTFPAILKGYFDRVLLPGIAFKGSTCASTSADGKSGLGPTNICDVVPLLTHITKVGAVATYDSTFTSTFLKGDDGRRFISNTLRQFFAPNCQMQWQGIYSVHNAVPKDNILGRTKTMFAQF
jgi:putative NADPH-quinone reductase